MKRVTLYAYAALAATTFLTGCAEQNLPDVSTNGLSNREQNLNSIAASTRASGNLDSAAELYRQMATLSDGPVVAHLELASIYRIQNKPELTIEVLERARTLQPHNNDVQIALGSAFIAANRPREAMALYQSLYEKDDRDVRALNGVAVSHDSLGENEAAQQLYRNALAIDPDDNRIKNNLALSYVLSGKYEPAQELLEKIIADEPENPTIRQNLALVYGLQGKQAKAMEMGLKDLTSEEAEENLRFYKFYRERQLVNGVSTDGSHYQAVPAEPVELTRDLPPPPPPPPASEIKTKPEGVKEKTVPIKETEKKPEPEKAAKLEEKAKPKTVKHIEPSTETVAAIKQEVTEKELNSEDTIEIMAEEKVENTQPASDDNKNGFSWPSVPSNNVRN